MRQAVDLAPGREDLRLALANLMAVNGKEPGGSGGRTGERNTTTNDGIRRRADVLLEALRTQIEAAQAPRDYQARRRAAGLQDPSGPQAASPAATARTAAEPVSPSPETRVEKNDAPRSPTRRVAVPQVEGFLSLIDCAMGMNLHVQTEQGTVVLHSEMPSRIYFVSYLSTPRGPVVLGGATPAVHVIVVYRQTTYPAVPRPSVGSRVLALACRPSTLAGIGIAAPPLL